MGIEPSVIAKMQGAGERGCKVMLCGPKHIFELVVRMFFKQHEPPRGCRKSASFLRVDSASGFVIRRNDGALASQEMTEAENRGLSVLEIMSGGYSDPPMA